MEVKSVRKPSKREGGDGTMDAEGEGVKGGSEGRKLEAKGKGIDTRQTGGDDEDGTFDGSFGHTKALGRRQCEGEVERAGAFTYLMVEIRCQRQTWDLP